MSDTAVSVSLHDGTVCKTFAAEVTGNLGEPLKGVEVIFFLDGEGSLAPDQEVSRYDAQTDGIGRASISINRRPGQQGDIDGQLRAECPVEAGSIQLRFIGMTLDHSRQHDVPSLDSLLGPVPVGQS